MSTPTRQQVSRLAFEIFPNCVQVHLDEIVSTSIQRSGELEIEIKPHRTWEMRLYFPSENYRMFREPSLAALMKAVKK